MTPSQISKKAMTPAVESCDEDLENNEWCYNIEDNL